MEISDPGSNKINHVLKLTNLKVALKCQQKPIKDTRKPKQEFIVFTPPSMGSSHHGAKICVTLLVPKQGTLLELFRGSEVM